MAGGGKIKIKGGIASKNEAVVEDGALLVTGISGAGGIDYSTSEQDTGLKFLGGETIFEKTLTFGAGPNNSIVEIIHGIIGLLVVVDVQGFMDNGVAQRSINNIESGAASDHAHWAVRDDMILLVSGITGDYSGYNGFVKLRYTKA